MQHLLDNVPDCDGLDELASYFSTTYVLGTTRCTQRHGQLQTGLQLLRICRIAPWFPPEKWNVHHATLNNQHQTNNQCESWNNSYRSLQGHSHPSVWTSIKSPQEDQVMAVTNIHLHVRGQLPAKRVRHATVRLQDHLHTLCKRYGDSDMDILMFLRSIGHIIRLP